MKSQTSIRFIRGCLSAAGLIIVLAVYALVHDQSVAADTSPQPTAIADSHTSKNHVFHYHPVAGQTPQNVILAGDFNGWSTTQMPMTRVGNDYELKLTLTEGVHYYKFIVDGHWLNDPQSVTELEVSDDNGGKNSAVMIGLDARKLPAPQPDHINAGAVAYDPADVRDFNIAGDNLLRVSLRTQAEDITDAQILIESPNGWVVSPLVKTTTQMGFDRFGSVVTPPVKPGESLHYCFELHKPGAKLFISGGKGSTDRYTAEASCYQAVMKPAFDTPDWAKHAVWYQIFPERFRNGDPSNDPPNTQKWTSAWFDKHPGESGDFYRDVWARRYGGDIQGIRQELPYLRSLGITAIYLNPIFQAEDLHKYDTSDYRHVDEHFGVKGDIEALQGETDDPATWQWTASDKVFLDFLDDAHRQGFKVIIDGVFNHVGRKFWAFQDVLKNGKDSKYASWFDITDWTPAANAPFHYHAWDGDNGALPALKKDAQLGIAHGPREHLFAITKRWLAPDGDPARGVDGFRLDAPEGIPHPFWTEWRGIVKATKPDAYITGEIWGWAQSYLQGDQYDAVMNYQFAVASQQFFVNQKTVISVHDLNSRANQLMFNYPFQSALVNQNLFDSHDTDRVASMFVNPDLGFDAANRIQDNGPHYNPAKPDAQQRLRMLQEVAWQMTFVGAPMIYYGDEAGMWSPDDPSDRQPMVWKDLQPFDDLQVSFDQDKFDFYQRLIAIRARFPALQTGFFRALKMDDANGIYVYSRDLGGQHVYVVLNHSAHEKLVDFTPVEPNLRYVNWLDPNAADVVQAKGATSNRPKLEPAKAYAPVGLVHGEIRLAMQSWGAAVLTSDSN